MSFLLGATCIVGIAFMSVFMFIGIWLFVVALKAFHNLKYKTFLLEKIYRKLDSIPISNNNDTNDTNNDVDTDFSNINKVENIPELNNVKNIK